MTTPTGANSGAASGSAATPRTRKTAAGAAAAKTTRAKKTPAGESAPAAHSGATQAQAGKQQHRRQQKIGRVTSDKMQKTIVVAVESLKQHPIYKRTYKYTNKFKAHDETNSARIGDTVRIEETRPLSKEKRWRLVEIIKRAEQTVAPEVVEERLEEQAGLTTPSAGTGATTGR